jgi:hypothetical protein
MSDAYTASLNVVRLPDSKKVKIGTGHPCQRMIEATVSYRSWFELKTSFIKKPYATKNGSVALKMASCGEQLLPEALIGPLKTAASNCNHTPASSTKNQPAGVGRSWLNLFGTKRGGRLFGGTRLAE